MSCRAKTGCSGDSIAKGDGASSASEVSSYLPLICSRTEGGEDKLSQSILSGLFELKHLDSVQQNILPDEASFDSFSSKLKISIPAGHILTDQKIVHFQTPSGNPGSIVISNGH